MYTVACMVPYNCTYVRVNVPDQNCIIPKCSSHVSVPLAELHRTN